MNNLVLAFTIYFILFLAPWIILTIYSMIEVRKLRKKLEKFIEENVEDDDNDKPTK